MKEKNQREKSKYMCFKCGNKLFQLCEYPKCAADGKKRTYIIRLCDFHESKYLFLCNRHYDKIKMEMKVRWKQKTPEGEKISRGY